MIHRGWVLYQVLYERGEKGPNGSNCRKIIAAIHTSKDFDFPLAFLLRCVELSLVPGCRSQMHFPAIIPAPLLTAVSHVDLCVHAESKLAENICLTLRPGNSPGRPAKGTACLWGFCDWVCVRMYAFYQMTFSWTSLCHHCTSDELQTLFWRSVSKVTLIKGHVQVQNNRKLPRYPWANNPRGVLE